jgi:transcriptional regulator with XRE-family HTH domain
MELKTARKVARLTQQELAKRAGVDTALISRLESGTRSRRPSYESIVRIARVLNLAPDELFPVPDIGEARKSA